MHHGGGPAQDLHLFPTKRCHYTTDEKPFQGKRNRLLQFVKQCTIMEAQIEQRPSGCKGSNVRLWGYKREWGQNPRMNQYRGHRDSYPLAKASHWGDLRRQGRESFEVRVGRTAVVDGIFAKNGYGDVRFVQTIAFFLSYKSIWNFRGRRVCRMTLRLNKRMGCKSPRCRRCKCRGGLLLTKVSHWGKP